MRAKILEMLLNGEIKADSPDEPVLNEYGLELHGKCFLVFSVAIDDENFSGVFTDGMLSSERLIDSISVELLKMFENTRVYACYLNREYAGVVSFPEEHPDKVQIVSAMDDLCVSLELMTGLDVICAVSPFIDNLSKLGIAYEKAREVMNFHFAEAEKCVYFYDDDLAATEWDAYTAENENKLISAVCSGDTDAALDVINRLIGCDAETERINLGALCVLSAEIINTLIKISHRIKDMEWSEYKKLYLIPTIINSIHRLRESRMLIVEYAKELCRLYAGTYQELKKQKCYYIAEYIEHNYMNPNLNVNMIAEEFHIDRSWISKRFKDAFGVGIFEYIISLRLKKAKMLLTTDMNINQVAKKAGFINSATFRYSFKKHEKITPSQYREILVK